MKLWTWLIAAVLVIAVGGGRAEAGKRKGAVSARVELGAVKKVGGLSIKVVLDNHKERSDGGVVGAFTLTAKKGSKQVKVASGWVDEPWFELVAHGKLIQVVPDGDRLQITVAPATKVAKKAISTDGAQAIVEKEAERRGIDHNGGGMSSGSAGVVEVWLAKGRTRVVSAVVGARSRDLLAFDVAAAAASEPADGNDGGNDQSTTPTVTSAKSILDAHNARRAEHCAPALSWSDELAKVAQAWADQLRDDGCSFEHSRTRYGENLAAGTAGTLSAADVVEMWYREVDQYDFDGGGFSMETGHFTQLVWKGTSKLGCGVAQCGGMDIWVCNYDPAGNVERGYAKNVLPTSCK